MIKASRIMSIFQVRYSSEYEIAVPLKYLTNILKNLFSKYEGAKLGEFTLTPLNELSPRR